MAATPATSLTLVTSGLADARQRPPLGNPNAQQFIKMLRKTTRWAAQYHRVEFDGSPEFGTRVSMTLPRNGDLITGFTLVVTMPDIYATQLAAVRAAGGTSFDAPGAFLGPTYGWTNALGHALVQRIELEIGGVIVDTLDSRLLEILDELYEPLEASVAKNVLICRAPSGFGPRTWMGVSGEPVTVHVPIPFWFSRPDGYAQALPIDALHADAVRVHVTFRPVSQLFYTDARVDSRTVGYRGAIDGADGSMWDIVGGRFWMSDTAATGRVYSMQAGTPAAGVPGRLVAGVTFPTRFSPVDAYGLVEYISLEEFEAIRIRSSELTYAVPQHFAVPPQATLGQKEIRVPMPYTHLVKELLWVAQRPEAETYNAWFLFTRDLRSVVPPYATAAEKSVCSTPWWPDATVVPSAATGWMVRPGFQRSYSEPIEGAMLAYGVYDRFLHNGGSFFRGVVPSQQYAKSAVIDRYVYAYSFGAGARAKEGKEAQGQGQGEEIVRGAANWEKIAKKDLIFTMANGRCGMAPPNMNLYIYMTTWNVFKVFGGRGAMLFM
jgi:hypothetical protein